MPQMIPGEVDVFARVEHVNGGRVAKHIHVTAIGWGRCSYGTPAGMRLAFERQLGVNPRSYRRRFSSAEQAEHAKASRLARGSDRSRIHPNACRD